MMLRVILVAVIGNNEVLMMSVRVMSNKEFRNIDVWNIMIFLFLWVINITLLVTDIFEMVSFLRLKMYIVQQPKTNLLSSILCLSMLHAFQYGTCK